MPKPCDNLPNTIIPDESYRIYYENRRRYDAQHAVPKTLSHPAFLALRHPVDGLQKVLLVPLGAAHLKRKLVPLVGGSMTTRKAYTTDLSELEWQLIEPLIPGPKRLGRKIAYSRREIVNAIFYLNRNGCAWRDLPGDFPPYGIVSHYYHAWRRCGLWQTLNDVLRHPAPRSRRASPSTKCCQSG